MTHTPHELAEDFPENRERIHDLKVSNAHFSKLADEYHEINRRIHRLETGIEGATDETERDLRKRRMALKDEIYALLRS